MESMVFTRLIEMKLLLYMVLHLYPMKREHCKNLDLATQVRDPAIHYQHSEINYNYCMSNIVAGRSNR